MKTIIYPIGPKAKSDRKLKNIAALAILAMGGFVIYDLSQGSTIHEEGHVVKALRKQKALVLIDKGPNKGEEVRAKWGHLESGFIVRNKPEEGQEVHIESEIGGLTGFRYSSKIRY